MSHLKSLAFLMLVCLLAVIGWFRQQMQGRYDPVFYVVQWIEGVREPLLYPVKDSSDLLQFGSCISFQDEKGERRTLCRNYKILSPSERSKRGGSAGKRFLIPSYMKEKNNEILPIKKDQVADETF